MSLVSRLKGKGPSGFGYGSTADEVTEGLDLKGRTILLTGANSGLGLETTRVLARRGARILAAGRSREKVQVAVAGLEGDIVPLACDLSAPESVRACVEAVRRGGWRPDAVICNAGIMALPSPQRAHGIELQLFTNHIGHFLLVTGLLEQTAANARIVILSSDAHRAAPREGIQFDDLSGEKGYRPWKAYGQSKLANLLFARELARRLQGTGRTANALHPGVIQTNLARSMSPLARVALSVSKPVFLKSLGQGAATQCYVAVHPGAAGSSGEYFADCNVAKSSALGRDAELARRLWDESEKIVARLP